MRQVIALFILLLFIHELAAQVLVTENIENERISNVLNDWVSKYDADFAFDSYELSRYRFKGTLNSVPLEDALDQLLARTPFDYRQLNATYIIYPKPSSKENTSKRSAVKRQLSGRVIDRLSGEPLPFASIGAVKSGVGNATDTEGRFYLFNEGGETNDTLVIAYLGYQLFRWGFDWDALPSSCTFELVPSESMLPDVEIQAQSLKAIQQETPPGVFTIHPNSSGLRVGAGESDVFRLAQFAPGISGVQENSNGLFIRGSSSGQSQLLMDGFNIYHQDHFFGMFSSVNAYAVKSMRVNKVFNEPSQGGRAAGSVELLGREGDLRKPSSRLEMGTMSISGALETPLDSSGKAALFVCGRRSLTDYIKGPAYREIFRTLYSASIVSASGADADEASQNFDPQLLFQDVNAKLTFRPTVNQHISASFYASHDDLSFNYADTSSAEAVNVSDIRYSDESGKSNRGLSLRWSAQLSPRTEVFNSVGYSQFRGYYFSTDSIRNNLFAIDSTQFSYRDVALRDWSALNSWKWHGGHHELKWGVMFNYVATSSMQRSSENSDATEEKAANTTTIFIGDEISGKRWLICPGLRFNIYNLADGEGYWEPRLSLRYALVETRMFLKAAATRSLQFVQRITNQSMYQNVPDRWEPASGQIPVLASDQLLLGLNYIDDRWSADVEAYYKYIQGQVLDAAAGQFSTDIYKTFFVGNARAFGIDAALQFEQQAHKVLLTGSWLNARSNYDGFDIANITETYNRTTEGKLAYEWTRGPWNASAFVIAASGAPFTALLGSYAFQLPDGSPRTIPIFGGYNRDLTSPYVRADIAGSYRWQWKNMRWQLVASVYNVLNTPNYRAIQYNVTPGSGAINQREIRMLGRIPSINLICQF